MSRILQTKKRLIKQFIKDNGRTPTEYELNKLLRDIEEWAPETQPMVPEEEALSYPAFIAQALTSLTNDRINISELTANLHLRAQRIQKTLLSETKALVQQSENILTRYKNNDFKTVYNEIPVIPDGAEVHHYYTYGPDAYVEPETDYEETYLEQDYALNSFNVVSGKEGVSLARNSEQIIIAALNIVSYSETGSVFLETLNSSNPISMIVRGSSIGSKGVDLIFDINADTELSSIELDVDPIQATVIVDGVEVLSKSVDGKTTLVVGKTAESSLVVRLTGTERVIPIMIRNVKLFATAPGLVYSSGYFKSLDLDISTIFGDLVFNPDQHIPPGTNIDWFYSKEGVYWHSIEKDLAGKYIPINWNSNEETEADINFVLDAANPKLRVMPLSISDPRNITVTMGHGAVLFATEELLGYNAFVTYVTPDDDAGYTLQITNPTLPNGEFLVEKIVIISDTFSYSANPGSIISATIPDGTHKLELVLNTTLNLSEYDYNDKGILDVLVDDYRVVLDLGFAADLFGRSTSIAIQPHGLTEYSIAQLPHFSNETLLDAFAHAAGNQVAIYDLVPGTLYDIVIQESVHSKTLDLLIGNEVHSYAGDGSDWDVEMYNEPSGDVTVDGTDDYTPTGSTITVTGLSTTATAYEQSISHIGTEPVLEFPLDETPLAGVSFVEDNLNVFFIDAEGDDSSDEHNIREFLAVDGDLKITLTRVSDALLTMDGEGVDLPLVVNYQIDVTGMNSPNHAGDYVEGDIIDTYYTSTLVIALDAEANRILVSNLPLMTTALMDYTDMKTITSPAVGEGTTEFILTHPHWNTDIAGVTVSVRDITAGEETGTEIDADSVLGNVVTVDLVDYETSEGAHELEVTIDYRSREHTEPYTFAVSYNYYASEPHVFSYNYDSVVPLTMSEIYSLATNINIFYDISYYTSEGICYLDTDANDTIEYDETKETKATCEAAGGIWKTVLFVKAEMNTDGKNTPIIRRIRFDRQ